jgi:flagellar biosynthetic protein FliR
MMVVIRTGGILFTAPVFGSTIIKAQIRMYLSIAIALILYPAVETLPIENPNTLFLMIMIFKELLIGICIGMLSHFLFVGVQQGGQIIGLQMGFGVVNVMDPSTNTQMSIIAQLLNITMLLLFIAIGGHYLVIGAIAESFRLIPLGIFPIEIEGFHYLAKIFSYIFITALKVTAPIFVTLLVLHFVMGIMGKMVPQLNILIVGFPLQISTGIIVMALSFNYFYVVYEKMLHRYFQEVANLLRFF